MAKATKKAEAVVTMDAKAVQEALSKKQLKKATPKAEKAAPVKAVKAEKAAEAPKKAFKVIENGNLNTLLDIFSAGEKANPGYTRKEFIADAIGAGIPATTAASNWLKLGGERNSKYDKRAKFGIEVK